MEKRGSRNLHDLDDERLIMQIIIFAKSGAFTKGTKSSSVYQFFFHINLHPAIPDPRVADCGVADMDMDS